MNQVAGVPTWTDANALLCTLRPYHRHLGCIMVVMVGGSVVSVVGVGRILSVIVWRLHHRRTVSEAGP